MDTARQPAPRPVRSAPARTLSVVTPLQGRGAMPTSDELTEWMNAVASRGDRTAFAALFKHFAPRIKAWLVRTGSRPVLAEELAQEAMVAVWRHAAQFDPARSGVTTWIFTIARHQRIDALRRGRLHDAGGEAFDDSGLDVLATLPADDPAPEAALAIAQREAAIRGALAALPPEQALVLRLSYFEEQPHAAIAQALALPLGTVKSRVRLAVLAMRRMLERGDAA